MRMLNTKYLYESTEHMAVFNMEEMSRIAVPYPRTAEIVDF